MREITLQQYLNEGHSQAEAAALLKRTPGAVSQMLKDGRQIFFVFGKNGITSCYEKSDPRLRKPMKVKRKKRAA